ncbi:MFS transporter [Bradyrhizobium sp. CAR08]
MGSDVFGPLKNQNFRLIWLSNHISNLGWLIQTVTTSWLMATRSSSDLMVALVLASATLLLAFILSLFVGAIADNFNRPGVMLVDRGLILSGSATLSTLPALGHLDSWVLLGFTFLIGYGSALNDPAWQASADDI